MPQPTHKWEGSLVKPEVFHIQGPWRRVRNELASGHPAGRPVPEGLWLCLRRDSQTWFPGPAPHQRLAPVRQAYTWNPNTWNSLSYKLGSRQKACACGKNPFIIALWILCYHNQILFLSFPLAREFLGGSYYFLLFKLNFNYTRNIWIWSHEDLKHCRTD